MYLLQGPGNSGWEEDRNEDAPVNSPRDDTRDSGQTLPIWGELCSCHQETADAMSASIIDSALFVSGVAQDPVRRLPTQSYWHDMKAYRPVTDINLLPRSTVIIINNLIRLTGWLDG